MVSKIGLFSGVSLSLLAAAAFIGCNANAPSGAPAPDSHSPTAAADGDKHEHSGGEHGTKGPHQGDLIELGDEEYHAELVHDESSGSVTIYILDKAAKAAVPIDATEITINLKHDGKGEQFKLAASPQTEDGTGKCSRFVTQEKELGEDLEAEGAEARLALSIAGKEFSGAIEHQHEGGHSH